MTDTKKPAKSTKVFSDDEMSAMKEAAKERKAAARRGEDEAAGEADALAKIAEMPAPDRAMAERIHAIVKASAPASRRRPGTGCPPMRRTASSSASSRRRTSSSAVRDTRLRRGAQLDDGTMWATSYAVTKLTAADEKKIGKLVKKAAG